MSRGLTDDQVLEAYGEWMLCGTPLCKLAAGLGIKPRSLNNRFVKMGLARNVNDGYHRRSTVRPSDRYGLYIIWCMK